MAKKNVEPQINLLPKEEFEASTFGRAIKWLLTTFRYIVIITEMIVMGAFFSRFALDARSGNLIDEINQKKAIISSYSTFEKTFRNTQDKLQTFTTYAAPSSKISPVLDEISAKIPQNITLTNISVNGPKIEITAIAPDETSANNLVTALVSSKLITNVIFTSVESKPDIKGISFVITASWGGAQNGS